MKEYEINKALGVGLKITGILGLAYNAFTRDVPFLFFSGALYVAGEYLHDKALLEEMSYYLTMEPKK